MDRIQPATEGPSTARSQAHRITRALPKTAVPTAFGSVPRRPCQRAAGRGCSRERRSPAMPAHGPALPHGRMPLPQPRTAVRHRTQHSPPGLPAGWAGTAPRNETAGPHAHTDTDRHTDTQTRAVGHSLYADSAEPRTVPAPPAEGPSAVVRTGAVRYRRSPYGSPETPEGRRSSRPSPAALPGPSRSHLPRHLGRRHRCPPATGSAPPGRAAPDAPTAPPHGGGTTSSPRAASPARAATARRDPTPLSCSVPPVPAPPSRCGRRGVTVPPRGSRRWCGPGCGRGRAESGGAAVGRRGERR